MQKMLKKMTNDILICDVGHREPKKTPIAKKEDDTVTRNQYTKYNKDNIFLFENYEELNWCWSRYVKLNPTLSKLLMFYFKFLIFFLKHLDYCYKNYDNYDYDDDKNLLMP